jgi:hypothetical protein
MIILNLDLVTGIAKFAQTVTIKRGAAVPVRIVFSATPGDVSAIQLALGDDSTAPTLLSYTDVFDSENDTTWTGILDGNATALKNFMQGKGATPVNLELVVYLDGNRLVTPNLSITVQPAIIPDDPTSESGPTYYTGPQVDTLLATKAALTVAGKYRIKGDGTFQLWNGTQNKWHAITVSGAAGAEVLSIGAGE